MKSIKNVFLKIEKEVICSMRRYPKQCQAKSGEEEAGENLYVIEIVELTDTRCIRAFTCWLYTRGVHGTASVYLLDAKTGWPFGLQFLRIIFPFHCLSLYHGDSITYIHRRIQQTSRAFGEEEIYLIIAFVLSG